MSLNITPDMIHELADHTPGRERDQVAILLGPAGWEVRVEPEGITEPALVALTAADVDCWCDGEPLDDDTAAALATPQEPGDADTYRIPGEDGDEHDPTGEDWAVVIGTLAAPPSVVGWDLDLNWQAAWWFDAGAAAELVARSRHDLREHGRTYSLWTTPGGLYVAQLESQHYSDLGAWTRDVAWVEVPLEVAVAIVYAAPADRITDPDRMPPALAAARHAADIASTLAPAAPSNDAHPGVREAAARRELAEQTQVVHATRVLSELLRGTVLGALKDNRAAAARMVILAYGGDQQAAAGHLGMHPSTLSNLVR